MHEMIMEEVNSNPILTEKEVREMMYFPSEEELRADERVAENICQRIELLLEETNGNPSEDCIRHIIAEGNNKRNIVMNVYNSCYSKKNRYISQTIRNKYTELWKQWSIQNYPNWNYTQAKLNTNIRNVLAVNGKSFNKKAYRQASTNRWRGEKVLPYAQ